MTIKDTHKVTPWSNKWNVGLQQKRARDQGGFVFVEYRSHEEEEKEDRDKV